MKLKPLCSQKPSGHPQRLIWFPPSLTWHLEAAGQAGGLVHSGAGPVRRLLLQELDDLHVGWTAAIASHTLLAAVHQSCQQGERSTHSCLAAPATSLRTRFSYSCRKQLATKSAWTRVCFILMPCPVPSPKVRGPVFLTAVCLAEV